MKDETRKEALAAEREPEATAAPELEASEEPEYNLEDILEEALEQYGAASPVEEPAETAAQPDEETESPDQLPEESEPDASEADAQAEESENPSAQEETSQTPETEPEEKASAEAEQIGDEPEETARFIQEQVTSALGDTYSEETLKMQEKRAEEMRKARERKEAEEEKARKKAQRKAALAAKVQRLKKRSGDRAEAPEETEETPDNVLSMPVSKLKPIRDVVGKVTEKALHYADEMYEQAEPLDPEEQLQEKYIPGTDEEKPIKRKKVQKERKPRRLRKPEPDIPPGELAKRYSKGLANMKLRLRGLLALCVVLLYLTIAADGTLPLPEFFRVETRITAAILLWGLGAACLLGLDVLWLGITAPKRERIGAHTLTVCGVAATLLDGLWYCFIGREGLLPFAALASCSILACLWGMYDRKKGLAKACETASLSSSPYRVTLDSDKWEGRSAFTKEAGSTEQFGAQIQSPDGAQRVHQIFVPLALIAAVLFALIASVGRLHPERFLWCLSVLLTAAAPLAGMLAYSQPFLRLARRLSGTVALAGWDGVLSMEGDANILVRDDDLFPVGSVKSQGIRTFNGTPLERVTSCTASMIQESGSGLTKLFSDLVHIQGGFFRRVDSMHYHEAGGLVATIRGEQVMIGGAGFMAVMHIPIQQGEYVKEAIFCAINGQLQAIFSLKYEQPRKVRSALQALIRAGVEPVLVTRDFNITPAMLHRRFKLPVNKMEYPEIKRRYELSAPGQAHNPVLGALVRRDGLESFAEAIIGARRLRLVVRLNTILTLLASAVGLILSFYLTFIAAFASLSSLNMLLFLLLWLVPNLLLSVTVDKF